jgi:hypothetical protein
MRERCLQILEEFMINEKLTALFNIDLTEFDLPTFLNDIKEEFILIKNEYNLIEVNLIVLLDLTTIPYDETILSSICGIIKTLEDKLIRNIDQFIIYKKNNNSQYILNYIEHSISRELFDKIVADNNISGIIYSALTNDTILSTISHPVKTDNN